MKRRCLNVLFESPCPRDAPCPYPFRCCISGEDISIISLNMWDLLVQQFWTLIQPLPYHNT